MQSFFIELAEKEDYANDIADLQWEEIKSHAGSPPVYIYNADKTNYSGNWNNQSVRVLFHLSHWIEMKAGWHRSDVSYSDTGGDLGKIIYKYIYTTVTTNNSVELSTYAGNLYKWKTTYDVMGRLNQFCGGVGLTKVNSSWSAHQINVDIVKDVNNVLRVYKTGENDYVSNSNCVIINMATNKYRIITKYSANSTESIIYVTLDRK